MGGRRRTLTDDPEGPYEAHRYMGGHTLPHPDGYVLEYAPAHPRCYPSGMVLQHRLVMERKLNRFLQPGEVVHHRDEDVANNDPDNLKLYASQSDHMKHHQQEALRYDPSMIDMVS